MRMLEVLIVGGGVMGAATAYALARRGRRVLLLEQFALGHAVVVRMAYHVCLVMPIRKPSILNWRWRLAKPGLRSKRMLVSVC